ncbi:hypothetical protein Scep_007729 [Stephania cephalantha]|uniref:Uncharacterized protein n=1 Tax=Stephania cephalantha TaxID=152367 RepID=A0AAP0PM23_9MAGN
MSAYSIALAVSFSSILSFDFPPLLRNSSLASASFSQSLYSLKSLEKRFL